MYLSRKKAVYNRLCRSVGLEKGFFGAAILDDFDTNALSVASGAYTLKRGAVTVEIYPRIDVAAPECDTDERFFLHVLRSRTDENCDDGRSVFLLPSRFRILI